MAFYWGSSDFPVAIYPGVIYQIGVTNVFIDGLSSTDAPIFGTPTAGDINPLGPSTISSFAIGGGLSGGGAGGSNTRGILVQPQIRNSLGQLCTPSVFNPSCKPPSCPAVFVNAASGADLGLPPDADQAVKTASSAWAANYIVNNGLVVPLRSSTVRTILGLGEAAAAYVAMVPVIYQEAVGLVQEGKAWYNGQCTTIWTQTN